MQMRRVDGTIELNDRQLCDVELLMNGGFSPLDGFMNPDSYNSVVEKARLPNGLIFGLPVVMDVSGARDDIKAGAATHAQLEFSTL
jgi:ATP sulfurylase